MDIQNKQQFADKSMEELYEYISSASNDGFLYVDYEQKDIIISAKLKELFEITNDEANEQIIVENICDEDRPIYIDKRERIIKGKIQSYEIEYRILDGKRWILHTGTNRYDSSGKLTKNFSFFKDITELKQKQLELEYMAYFDSETGVYNRNYFVKRLEHAVQTVDRSFNRIQVIYIDIDNYNVINDSYGFILGDELIVKFAKILNSYSSHTTKIGRFNNDEFVIALYDAAEESSAIEIYNRIIKRLESPIVLSNQGKVYLSISVGISVYPVGGLTATDLIRCADIAMYNVKQHGKNGMLVFKEGMLRKFLSNVRLEQKLKTAVDNLDFSLNYQPQYYSNHKGLRGVEALIRWKLPTGEFVSPNDFIPMAEKNGCIINIGTWVIKQALKDYAVWARDYEYDGIISINISAVQLKEKNFKNTLLYYVEQNRLTPNNIEIEITESVLIDDFKTTIGILREIREKGFKISLDDFGTGYSSLSYLRDIPIDTLKIDKSFVDLMLTDSSTSIITNAVITMVKKLGLETIAEGVETKEQYDYLKKMNCDNIQGFLLGKPMTSNRIIETIMKEKKNKLESCSYV